MFNKEINGEVNLFTVWSLKGGNESFLLFLFKKEQLKGATKTVQKRISEAKNLA